MSERPLVANGDVQLVWKFRVLVEATNAMFAQGRTDLGDIPRQMGVVVDEMLRREFFRTRHIKTRSTAEVRTFYEYVKAYIEAPGQDKCGTAEDQYREIIAELKLRGVEMPSQEVSMDALDVSAAMARLSKRG